MRSSPFRWTPAPVVGTALGLCTPAGADAVAVARAVGRGHRAPPVHRVAPEALDAALRDLVPPGEQRRMDRLTRFGAAAGLGCMCDAGLHVDDRDRDRVGVLFNTAFGAFSSTDEFMATATPDIRGASPFLFPYTVQNACTGMVTILLGVRGVNTTVSGLNPVACACDVLRMGRASAMLAGGYEELTPRLAEALRAPGRLLGDGGRVPGAAWADPIASVAEGAVVVMLETAAHAAAREARVLFEVLGYATGVSLLHTRLATIDNARGMESRALRDVMQQALQGAAVDADAIDLVIGCARADNSQLDAEDEALAAVFPVVPDVLRPKVAIGDMLGASDALAVAVAAASGHRAPVAEPALAAGPSGSGSRAAWEESAAGCVSPNGEGARLVLVNGFQLGGHVSAIVLRIP